MEKIVYKRGIVVEKDETDIEEIKIDASRMIEVAYSDACFWFGGKGVCMGVRVKGNFADKSIYLPGTSDWVLCKDEGDIVCLVPLKKENE